MTLKRRIAVVGTAVTLAASLLSACSPATGDVASSQDPGAAQRRAPIQLPGFQRQTVESASEVSTVSWPGKDIDAEVIAQLASTLDVRSGTGDLVVAVLPGATLPDEVGALFTEASGFNLVIEPVQSVHDALGPADLVVGLDRTEALAAAKEGYLDPKPPADTTVPDMALTPPNPVGAVPYGRDDICVIADVSWFSSNNRAVPVIGSGAPAPEAAASALDTLASAENAPMLLVPDPASTIEGRAFAQVVTAAKGETAADWVKAAKDAGLRLVDTSSEAEAAWSGARLWGAEADMRAPLVVGRQSLVTAASDNTGTQSAAQVIPGTCVERTLFVAPMLLPPGPRIRTELRDAEEAFIEVLTSDAGQRLLAMCGAVGAATDVATPDTGQAGGTDTADSVQAGTPAAWFLTPGPADVVAVSDQLIADPTWAVSLWK